MRGLCNGQVYVRLSRRLTSAACRSWAWEADIDLQLPAPCSSYWSIDAGARAADIVMLRADVLGLTQTCESVFYRKMHKCSWNTTQSVYLLCQDCLITFAKHAWSNNMLVCRVCSLYVFRQFLRSWCYATAVESGIIIPAKARDYVFTGVGLFVCLSVCLLPR